MSLLWILIGVLLICVFGFLMLPLIRQREAEPLARTTYDVAIYKDQMAEAERELERGLLSNEQAEAVKIELQRKLLAATETPDSGAAMPETRTLSPRLTGIAVLLFVGVGSLGGYAYLGSPKIDNLAYADRDIDSEQQDTAGSQQAVAEMSMLVDRLEKKMQENPDNIEGWLMLARSASSLGQFPRALKAYEQAMQMAPNDPQILVDYAETDIFLNEGRVANHAFQTLEKARQINPAHPKARYYMALRHAQTGALEQAVQEWIDLLAISLPDASWVPTVRQQINSAANEAEIDLQTLRPSEEAVRIGARIREAAKTTPTVPGPTREDVENAEQMTPEDRQEMIRSMVQRLADRLEDNPNDREGWLRLANAYTVLGETKKATDARARAAQIQSQ